MGWNRKSTGRIAQNTPSRNSDSPPRRPSDAERRTKVYVRINSLPYSAHRFAAVGREAIEHSHTPREAAGDPEGKERFREAGGRKAVGPIYNLG